MLKCVHARILACNFPRRIMRSLAFLSQKGGSGKTTLAVHIAVAAEQRREKVIIIDTDPQASASVWATARQSRGTDTPKSTKANAASTQTWMKEAETQGYTLAVIDTAPHAISGIDVIAAAVDFLLIPCRPSVFDLAAIESSVKIAKAARKPAAFILNDCAPRGPELTEAREVLVRHGYPVAPVTIGDRKAFSRAIITGEAVTEFDAGGKAAQEIVALWRWLKKHMGAK
jgi:chromosome partitioning protein